jgi:alcohol dehydrogenase
MPPEGAAMSGFVIEPKPAAHFGVGAIEKLPAIVRGTGASAVVVVTDEALAASPVIATVCDILLDAGLPAHVFSGVHSSPTTDDLAAGAAAVAYAATEAAIAEAAAAVAATLKASAPAAPVTPASGGIALVAVGGGSPIDAAKGIALAAVNPERGRDLDYRGDFAVPGLPIVVVPTTAGTGAEANSFGVMTDPATRRRFYVGHATTMPAAAILDPALTVSMSPAATAATGMDALTHALESYLSLRPNPWSDGLALQAIRMIAANLPRAVHDGTDLDARSQLLLAAHLAGVAMANTGLGVCHAIGHSLGGRWDITHGVALSMLLPDVLRFNLPVRAQRMADIAFALGAGDTHRGEDRNAAAAIDAVAALRDRIGLTAAIGDFGITEADFAQIAADALADEVLRNTPRPPTSDDIGDILASRAG